MNRRTRALALMLAVFAAASLLAVSAQPAEASDGTMLVDYGDGTTVWTEAGSGTYSEALASGVKAAGSEYSYSTAITIDGLAERTTGSVTAQWRVYLWEDGAWNDVTSTIDLDSAYSGGSIALGFYPEGTAPVETPTYKSSWTMVRGDSGNSGSQTAELSSGDGTVSWAYSYGNSNYVDSTILIAGQYAYVVAGGGYTASAADPTLYCYDRTTGEVAWSFSYDKGAGYETATGVIVGDYIYLPATNGTLYRIPLSGPGDDNANVQSLAISKTSDHDLTGTLYSTGPASLVYDSGVLYFGTSNGYVYCVDLDLNVVWQTAVGGCVYYNSPTVYGEHVLIGALDGTLYAFDRYTGSITDSEVVYTTTVTVGGTERTYGGANVAVAVGDILMVSFSDGRGMNSTTGGVAGYTLSGGTFTEVFKNQYGLTSTYITPVVTDGFSGVYCAYSTSVIRVSTAGVVETMTEVSGTIKSPITLVNGTTLYVAEYDRGGYIYAIGLDGSILGSISQPDDVSQYCMGPVVVIDGMVFLGTDGGAFGYTGSLLNGVVPGQETGSGISGWLVAGAILLILIIAFIAYVIHIKRTSDMPVIAYIRVKLRESSGFNNERTSKVKKNKRRLALVLIIGLILAAIIFVVSLAVGPSETYGFTETISILISSIQKTFSGESLNYDEIIVFDSRCSRAVAAFAVGIGLSIAGSVYQAIIRNPMVDPYIMGVSAGAGVAAVATIAFDFTFFGLLSDTTFATPIVAMIGGVVAFGCTMLLAEKAGGSSLNYVLAGVIVGLVFSALQTLMLSMAGDKLNDAMSWLFGSFANISWTEAILVTIPAIAMSLVPLVWAKEFNLVLLGEDQARQMGLDVKRFNRWMLILASVLASVCVAFVGIIGFVGLVVPHLCRMILGGDHRLVMPASIVVGGALMMAADLFSKMVMVPLELPVGAITTVIGAPVFAYLLIKKGRMYDG
ncbi:MAG: iron chelate uptake ABC transporter family permease subunit [Thermoplasmata archaeon]|nr:iron chelate uptake ABC transporter family permease subunit [Thermoplasmata archaeon]